MILSVKGKCIPLKLTINKLIVNKLTIVIKIGYVGLGILLQVAVKRFGGLKRKQPKVRQDF